MPLELTRLAFKGLSARHLMVLIAILVVFIVPERTALGIGTGDELLRALHHSSVQCQADLFKSSHIEYLQQHVDREGFVAAL